MGIDVTRTDAGELVLEGVSRVPGHIAITMDGNGRWARSRGLSRSKGHEAGAETARIIVEECARLRGVDYVTLYSFGRDNWKRPRAEVQGLWRLLRRYLASEFDSMMKNNIRVSTIGEISRLPALVRRQIRKVTEASRENTGLRATFALNYGSRDEITRAVRAIAREVAAGGLKPGSITEATIARRLDTADLPDPDLMIRTSGEMRLSDFLLWQLSYTELYVTDVLWPDFREPDLYEAIAEFDRRERRFGGVVNDQ